MKKNREVPYYLKIVCKTVLNTRGKLFVFVLSWLLCSITLQAQGNNVTLHMKNANLEQVIWEIQKQTKFVFMYGSLDVKNIKGLNVDVKGRPALDVLRDCLKDTELTFTVEKENVVIKKKAEPVPQQQKRVIIEGVVKDENGEIFPGVTVLIKGTNLGVSTDINGKYKLEGVIPNGSVVVFSFVGLETKEITYTGQKTLNVVMEESSQKIAEVVVTGYQKIDRRLFTGSADIVKAENLELGGSNDVSRALQGKSSGVQIQNVSGTFGAAPKMRVRGASSIYGDQKPLWVVDNIVLEDVVDVSADDLASGDAATLISSAVAGLNPEDIETFQVLKDASATAFYGARAMNGVVVITTKRGRAGVVRVGYSGEFTIRQKPQYREYNIMNSQQQMMFYRDMEAKGWLNYADVSRAANGGIYRKMYDKLDEYNSVTGTFTLKNTPEERMKFLQQYEKLNTDWFDVLFKNSVQQSHSISLSGGTERSNFFASLSFLEDPGWTIGDKVSRYTANMNATFNINEYLKFSFSTNNSFRRQRAPGTIARETDPVTGSVARSFDLNPFSFSLNTSRTMRPYDDNGDLEFYVMNYAPFNIIHELKKNYMEIDMLDSQFQVEFDIEPTTGLDMKLIGAVRYVKSTREHKIREGSNLAECYRADYDATIRKSNHYLYTDPDDPGMIPESVLPQGGFYNRTDNRMLNYYLRSMANYTRNLNDKHIFNVTAGMELRSVDRRETYSNGFGIQYDRGNVPFIDYRIIKQLLEKGDAYFGLDNKYDRFVAFFASGGYNWNDRYTINLTGRYDGSNRMGQSSSSRWLPTWNVSGSWNVSNENFMAATSEIISTLTLRATYGLTASMGPTTNAKVVYRNDIAFRPSAAEQENQIVIEQLQNTDLTWEKQYEFNTGFDLGLFYNNISLSGDIYFRKGFDLIGVMRTSGIGGEAYKYANYADMKSNGVELTLNTKNIQRKLNWSTNVTFAWLKNKITQLGSATNVMGMVSSAGAPKEGRPVRGVYAIPFMGLNQDGLPTFINQDEELTVSGINFQESRKLDFLKYMGPVDPKITGGIENSFKYGPLRLSIFFTYQFGNKIWLYPAFSFRYYDNQALPKEMADRWMVSGDEHLTSIPAMVSKRQFQQDAGLQAAYNAYNYSTDRVVKGDFIRLKDISLNYDLPKNWLEQIGFTSASLRLALSNIALLYSDKKLKGQDPEFARSGGVSLPVPRQFTLSLKFGL